VNAQEKDGWTSLHWAAFKGRLEIVQVLLNQGANVNLETEGGETALHIVSRGKYGPEERGVGIARLLLERGVDVHVQNKNLNTALHIAASNWKLEITRLLLSHGANVNVENVHGQTPLYSVSGGNHNLQGGASIARLFNLMERGVGVNAQKKNTLTPLHLAAMIKRRLKIALDRGVNMNLETKETHDSEEHGVGIARLLLERGVDVHVQSKNLNTALHTAAFNGRLDIVQVLIDHGANPNVGSQQGSTPLHLVSAGKYNSQGHGIAQLLVEHGMDVNAQNKNKFTPLHFASFKGRLQIVQVLLIFLFYC
jgi:ankyrin repeat protein